MNKKDILFGLLTALFLALVLSPFASSFPDGLERVAEDKGFLEKGEGEPVLVSPVPDYTWPGIKNEKLATSAAGVMGTLVVFGAAYGFAALIKRQKSS
ncbi:MAG TPA: PDGLE domain-containing protein [Candidatus Omnitrophota bacterium]|nr:PDGLE domain-containing protein [Candidatus Omnitrophota bacterium]